MDYDQLLEYLDLADPSEFIYFEAMADLVESEEDIAQEAVFALFSGADATMITELMEDYFEDVLEGVPSDAGEMFNLLHQIKMFLTGLAANMSGESDLRRLTDEFCRFRDWYSRESHVELLPENGGEPLHQCLRDAITTARIEKLGGEIYRYSFEDALDYPLDSYIMSFSELASAEDDYNEGAVVYSPEEIPEEDDFYIIDEGKGGRRDH